MSFTAKPAPVRATFLPPFPAPLPERTLVIHYTDAGLLIVPKPHATKSRDQTSSGALWKWQDKPEQIKGKELTDLLAKQTSDTASIECFGLVGSLKLFKNSYLFVITKRDHVGDFLDPSKAVYCCSGVLAIPLAQTQAKDVIQAEAARVAKAGLASDTSGETGASSDEEDSDIDDVATPSVMRTGSFMAGGGSSTLRPADLATTTPSPSSSTQDGEKIGEHGTVTKDTPAELPETLQDQGPASVDAVPSVLSGNPAADEANRAELEDKLVKEAARYYARGEMYFTYSFDLTTPLQRKHEQFLASGVPATTSRPPFEEPRTTLPLWRRADARFWHNESMSKELIEADLHSLVLPMMQGYFQVANLPIAHDEAEGDATAQILIISRRSKERPGVRYQRRGVNDQGQVANFVETEQVFACRRIDEQAAEGSKTIFNLFSFVQIRGSPPVYWKQNAFTLKPPPVLDRSQEENERACAKHFELQTARYGPVTCINLAEQHGKEGEITEAYRSAAEKLIKKGAPIKYQPFDFHKECAGMKFENISKLIDMLKDTLAEMDCFWRAWGAIDKPGEVLSLQKGILRVNCMDCLDRTGVCQSAFGRYMIQQVQLERLGVVLRSPHSAHDLVFNDAWANNGDQISRIYANTRALKGDFTRTGKRNVFGMLNDATNSVYRTVYGATADYWRQTVISFVYGELSLHGLERYVDDLSTADPSTAIRMKTVRAAAIETCTGMALQEGETKLAGWTMWGPVEPNIVRSDKYEEKVVLLTATALYICSYDFSVEKLSEFSRILLGDIASLTKGAYVISPRDGAHPDQHWGVKVSYRNESVRLNNMSIDNAVGSTSSAAKEEDVTTAKKSFVALKAIADDFAGTLDEGETPSSSSSKVPVSNLSGMSSDDLTSKLLVDHIISLTVRECSSASGRDRTDLIKEESIQR